MMIISIVHICINELKITPYLENCKRGYTDHDPPCVQYYEVQ